VHLTKEQSPWPRDLAGWGKNAAGRLRNIANTLATILRTVAQALAAALSPMVISTMNDLPGYEIEGGLRRGPPCTTGPRTSKRGHAATRDHASEFHAAPESLSGDSPASPGGDESTQPEE